MCVLVLYSEFLVNQFPGKGVKTMASTHLPYTLQTRLGMVTDNGLPIQRLHHPGATRQVTKTLDEALPSAALAKIPYVKQPWHRHRSSANVTSPGQILRFQDFVEADWNAPQYRAVADTAAALLRAGATITQGHLNAEGEDASRFLDNVEALRNPKMDIHRLMTAIKARGRLDLEQAAGAVVAAFVNAGRMDDACVLVGELAGVLAVGDMAIGEWEMAGTVRQTMASGRAESLSNLSHRVCLSTRIEGAEDVSWEKRSKQNVEFPSAARDIVAMLLRVRRVAPRDRCLHIPAWLFEEAGIEQPGHHARYNEWFKEEVAKHGNRRDTLQTELGCRHPTKAPEDDSIILSRNAFRAVQRRVHASLKFWEPPVELRQAIHAMEDRVLYDSDWIKEHLRETDDVAPVAHWFFTHQRRLQLKVVSDDEWTRFLEKGESGKLYQNNLSLKSTFEDQLAKIASRSYGGGLDVETTAEDTLALIDRVCLLMKSYVDIHGQGDKENLVFKKGVSGGNRGPVDEYNLLCNIMSALKKTAKEAGIENVPGPVYKFLAKDIMHWNDSWEDDAFAAGKAHGWEAWIQEREL